MRLVEQKGRINTGPINWIGLWTLYTREVNRFLKVTAQTVIGPAVTTLLFVAVFAVVMTRRGQAQPIGGVSYLEFLAPGLVMMAMAQNAFANTSFSLLIAKVQGNIADFLMAPLTGGEIVSALALGGVTRGLLVGGVVTLAIMPFVPMDMAHPAFVLFHAVAASLLLALLGVLGGLWAQKMDHLGAVTNFIVTPLTFLSGTFYSAHDLPSPFRAIAHANPFFYMIDGFRYGVTGYADGSLATGLAIMTGTNVLVAAACYRLVTTGWRLKP
ncbi:MAG: ABC transporter permease [Alphaproteobacteria bacterium]